MFVTIEGRSRLSFIHCFVWKCVESVWGGATSAAAADFIDHSTWGTVGLSTSGMVGDGRTSRRSSLESLGAVAST